MSHLSQELRLAVRRLLRSPGYSLSVLLILAIGIGANTANFSIVDAVLLRPLPYPDSERLVHLYRSEPRRDLDSLRFSLPLLEDLQEQNSVFEQLGAYYYNSRNVTGGDGEAETLTVGRLTTNLLPLLGAQPAFGRVFSAAEGQPGEDRVALLSDGLWRRRFAADPHVLGRTLELDGTAFTVVGVMAPDFNFPYGEVELWTPAALDRERFGPEDDVFQPVGRLRPGVGIDQARSELTALFDRLEASYPRLPADGTLRVVPLRQALVFFYDVVRLMMLLGVVAHLFVLVIICANVANLMLTRSMGRQRDLAVRSALGAGRGRLALQYLAEGLVLALAATLLGSLLAYWLAGFIGAMIPAGLYRVGTIAVDRSALLFAVALALLTVVLFALVPALRASRRVDLVAGLKEGATGTSGGRRRGRLRSLLIVAQVANAVILLVGTSLMVRSFELMRHVDTGFDATNVLTVELRLSQAQYPDAAATRAYYDRLLTEVGGLPGVASVAAVEPLPLNFQADERGFRIAGREPASPDERLHAREHRVTAGYFGAMRLPLVAGRTFHEDGGNLEVVVDRTFAERWWPGASALGATLELEGLGEEPVPATVVGVAADSKNLQVDEKPAAILYLPQSAAPQRHNFLVLRVAGAPMAAAAGVRDAVERIGGGVPVVTLRPMERVVGDSLQPWAISSKVLAALAILALLLAGIGIYGVVAHGVRQRVREIGIRIALGADRRHIVSTAVGQGVRLAVVGLVLGLAAALVLSRLLASVLFGVGALDPLALAVTLALLALTVLTAVVVPMRRASRLDPVEALRVE